MTDEDAIRNALSRYWLYVDDRRADDWLTLFDEAARISVDGEVFEGLSEIRGVSDLFRQQDSSGTHAGANADIEVNGDKALAESDVVFFVRDGADGLGIRISYTARCRDVLVRRNTAWVFSERVFEVRLGVHGA